MLGVAWQRCRVHFMRNVQLKVNRSSIHVVMVCGMPIPIPSRSQGVLVNQAAEPVLSTKRSGYSWAIDRSYTGAAHGDRRSRPQWGRWLL
jgi:hypothetical protein